jgi:hypothetical protein
MNDEDLRDLFAGLALVGMLSAGRKNVEPEAYRIADAMIEEKYYEKPEDTPPEEVGIAAVVKRTRKKHG